MQNNVKRRTWMEMKTTKIVFVGAGSMSFGGVTYRDLFTCRELKGSTLSLVDIDKDNLERMYDFALKMNDATGADFKIERTQNRRDVMSGAEFVINSIALERCRLWKYDFEIPRKYGIRHSLGENGGPGGLFHTMRSIPVIMDILKDMEELCPKAYFVNFSNPENRIILAAGNYSKIKCIGLCHGLTSFAWRVTKIMGMQGEDIELWAAGLNHFQWIKEIKEKSTGKDLYPLLKERSKTFDPSYMPVSRKLMDVFGLFPSPSDDHVGEYLQYGWEGGEEGYDFDADEKYRMGQKEEIEGIIRGDYTIGGEWLKPTDEKSAVVISGILNNKKTVINSGIVMNNGALKNLPPNAAVEVPVMLDGGGIHPVTVGELPRGIESLLNIQLNVQMLAVEAAIRASRELALQALLVDPVVNSIKAAEGMLDELWEINKEYIRPSVTE